MKSTKQSGAEFRWSTSINQFGLLEEKSLFDFNLPDPDESPKKAFLSSSTMNVQGILPLSNSPSSPRLPDINQSKKKKKLSSSMTDIHHEQQSSPLLLTYSQLHHAQISLPTKKKSRAQYSILPALNAQSNDMSIVNHHHQLTFSSESTSQGFLSNNKYIRLPISQLKRLHVSDKYIKEAKNLYFNAASKVFVPQLPFLEIS